MITQKLPYDTPSTDVLDVRPEGVICTSIDKGQYDPINWSPAAGYDSNF